MFEQSLLNKKGYTFWLPSIVFLLAALTGLVGSATVPRAEKQTPANEQPESTDPWGPLRLLEGNSWSKATSTATPVTSSPGGCSARPKVWRTARG